MPNVTQTGARPQAAHAFSRVDHQDLDRLLTPKDAAFHLRLSESWLAKSRMRGDGPRFRKFGRSVRYSLRDLIDFERSRSRSSTSEY